MSFKVPIDVTPQVVEMLVALQRIKYYQRADPLEIGKAMNVFVKDWEASGIEDLQEFIRYTKEANNL